MDERTVQDISFRRATVPDADALWHLRRRSISELAPAGMPTAIAEAWARKMTLSGMERKLRETDIWVAERNGVIVAWVSIKGDCLEGLYTDPSCAGQGIGTALLRLAESAMHDNGVEIVRAEASWNAEGFYLRRGYEPTGPRPADGPRPIVKHMGLSNGPTPS